MPQKILEETDPKLKQSLPGPPKRPSSVKPVQKFASLEKPKVKPKRPASPVLLSKFTAQKPDKKLMRPASPSQQSSKTNV